MNKALRVPDYLAHILQAIERIERHTEDIDEMGFIQRIDSRCRHSQH
jgi:uncharacterized protein with HEPN domain